MLVALAGLLALALGACGSSGAAEAPQAAADPNGGPTVTIKDLAYTPATLTVAAGTTVTWVWNDGAIAHDVKADGLRSKVIAQGTFRHRFTQPGTWGRCWCRCCGRMWRCGRRPRPATDAQPPRAIAKRRPHRSGQR